MEFEKLQEIIAGVLKMEPERIKPEMRFVEDLGADSLEIFQIIIEIEEAFGVVIGDAVISTVKTVEDAAKIMKNLG